VPSVSPSEHRVEKQRYVTLDALRGVAAVIIVLFHTGHRVGTWWPQFGYLAVDLFFLLSGFVLSYNYEARFRRGMRTSEFLVARVVRLYPLYFLGLVLGACLAPLNMDFQGLTVEGDVVSFCVGLVGLPSYVLPHGQYLFVVNAPFWSLFLEFWVANLLFVMLRKALRWKVLLTIIFVCGAGLVISEKTFYTLNVGGGWGTIASGFARVGFSFFYGVAIARIHTLRPANLKLPSWLFAFILLVLLSLPLHGRMSDRYDLACVFVLFPALVYWGAVAVERRPWVGAALGDASYALYTIHYPLWVLVAWAFYNLAVKPSVLMEFLFLLVVAPLAWGLSIADTRIRAILMSRVRAWRSSRREAVTSNGT
jgi:peptidoglycan/LPS O-acetylase OafA/YrhL